MKNRLKNYGLWVSVASLIGLTLTSTHVMKDTGTFNTIVQSVLGILVLAGIINNPATDHPGYLDDKQEQPKGGE